jgi:hypothetical protein
LTGVQGRKRLKKELFRHFIHLELMSRSSGRHDADLSQL